MQVVDKSSSWYKGGFQHFRFHTPPFSTTQLPVYVLLCYYYRYYFVFYVYILDTFCRCHSYLFSLTLTMLVCCMKFNPFSSFRLELLEFPVNTSVPWLPLCMLTCYVIFTILNRPNPSFDIFLISCLHDTNIGSTPPSYTFNFILYFSNMYLLQHDIFGTR